LLQGSYFTFRQARGLHRYDASGDAFHYQILYGLFSLDPGVDIWEHNKELIRKRTDIGEHFTREDIQSIVFIFLPLRERVHLTNPVYYY